MASLAVRHTALLLRQGEWGSAAAVLAKPGILCPDPKLLQLCRDVALEVLSAPAVQRRTEAEEHVWCDCVCLPVCLSTTNNVRCCVQQLSTHTTSLLDDCIGARYQDQTLHSLPH